MARGAAHVVYHCGEWMRCWVIVIGTDPPPDELSESAVFMDTTGDLHRRFGASAECAYLLRPDGYVAYRSQPARLEDLIAYLQRLRR